MPQNLHIPDFNKLASSDQSRNVDVRTINEFGIDGFTLMEIAASGAANIIRNKTGEGRSGLFICGKGNNAGDAIAAARYLHQYSGHSVTLFFAMGTGSLSPDTQKNLDLIKKINNHSSGITFVDSLNNLNLEDFDYLADGIFGTGLNSNVRGPAVDIIEQINHSNLPVFSMDVPSGLDSETGRIKGVCVKADTTITFGTNKLGFYLNDAKSLTGTVEYIPLPFPNHLRQYEAVLINNRLCKYFLPIRRNAKHKYDQGVVHVIAGSEGLTGAAIMAAQAAWKQGAGAVFLYSPKKLLPIYEKNLPQVIKIGVGDNDDTHFRPGHAKTVLTSLRNKPGVLLAGPGTGTTEETKQFLYNVLNESNSVTILDADALSDFNRIKTLPAKSRKKWVLTPHPGEAKKYLNLKFNDDFERLKEAKDFVNRYGCAILIKGNPTICIDTRQCVYLTGYDTGIFTRAGFGDVLSGTIATNIGITGEETLSVLGALMSGYNKYSQFPEKGVFGPEHLL